MSKLNKIITNRPVVLTNEEVNNLSETLSAVRTAAGEGGPKYEGDNKYIGVDDSNYKIKFLDNAAEKLESISSKLDKTEAANTYLTSADAQTLYQTKEAMSDYAKKTEIPDSITDFADTDTVIYSYINPATADIQQQINDKQTKLKFDLNDKGEISAIGTEYGTTTALAGANGITGDYYSASNPSGFINSAQAETQILEKHYLTEASGNSLYVPIPEGLSDGQYYAMTTSSWKVIQGAGDVSGISTVAHDDTLTGNGNNENLGVDFTKVQTKLTDAEIQNITDVTTLKTASSTWDSVTAKLTTAQYAIDSATFVTKPDTTQTVLNNNYLIYSTLTDPTATTGWMPLSANYYSKTEADGRYQKKEDMSSYLTTAKYETDSATFVTSSSNTITGTKQYALTTAGWSDIGLSAYLPTSGGTVSGELIVSGGGNFDTQFLKITRENVNGYGRIGLGSSGPLALKVDDANSHTTQINISPNTTNDQLVQVQHNGNQVGFLIPAVTATTTAGLTDDGILHIILES